MRTSTPNPIEFANRRGDMSFWKDKRVLITGGAGFLGSRLAAKLQARNPAPADIFIPRRQHYDLVNWDNILRLYSDARPDIVIHLAAEVGGIGANRSNPAG